MLTVFKRSCLFLAAAVVLATAGCQPAPQKAAATMTRVAASTPAAGMPAADTPAAAASPTAAPTADLGYPAGLPVEETAAYPVDGAGGAPAAVPAVDNQSKVTAKLIAAGADPDNSSYTKLHVQVLKSEDASGPNFTSKLVNQEADLYVETAKLPQLNPGDEFSATVSYRGDEHGGKYMVVEINK